MTLSKQVIREAKRLRNAYAKDAASCVHFRIPQSHGVNGILGYALPLNTAIETAKDICEGTDRGLIFHTEEESEPWDGDIPAPKYLLCCYVTHEDNDRQWLASLGMVGVNSLDDPYLDSTKGELFREALDEMDRVDDRKATIQANELAERPTYAGNVQP